MGLDHPWTEPPRPGTVVDVLPGIKWLRMPLPFRLDHINLWLLEDGAGWAAVDTGIGLEETRALWERVFTETLGGRPLTRVVVTHFHPDHMGNAGWLTERWRAGLWCTQAEWLYAQWAWRSRDAATLERRLAHYRRHGCAEAALGALAGRLNPYPKLVPTLAPEFQRICDGDALAIGGRRWEVVTAYGHAPEHACLSCRAAARRGGGGARRAAARRRARPRPVPPRARPPPARLRAGRGARPPALPRGGRPRRAPGRRRWRPPLPQGVRGPRQLKNSTRPTG